MNVDTDFRMTDLEEELTSADGAKVKAELLEKLSATGASVAKKIGDGLPPKEFEDANVIYRAFAAAHEVVSTFPVQDPDYIKT